MIAIFCAIFYSPSVVAQKTSDPVNKNISKSEITAQYVIDKYLDALGGKAKLEAIKSTITENTMTVQGMDIAMVTKKMGNKFKSSQLVMGQSVIQVFDGEKGYVDQMGTRTDLPESAIPDLKKLRTVEALGFQADDYKDAIVEALNDHNYYVLVSDNSKLYFDMKTGLLYRTKKEMGDAIIKSYLTVAGVQFPEHIEVEGNGQKVTIKTTKVIVNSGVSDEDFK